MSYNMNAKVRAFRSNAEDTVQAILLRVNTTGENGIVRTTNDAIFSSSIHSQKDSLLSVLTVDAQPLATDSVSVRCHNGSTGFAEEIYFLPNTAGIAT